MERQVPDNFLSQLGKPNQVTALISCTSCHAILMRFSLNCCCKRRVFWRKICCTWRKSTFDSSDSLSLSQSKILQILRILVRNQLDFPFFFKGYCQKCHFSLENTVAFTPWYCARMPKVSCGMHRRSACFGPFGLRRSRSQVQHNLSIETGVT